MLRITTGTALLSAVAGFSGHSGKMEGSDINPCNRGNWDKMDPPVKQPIWTALADLPCEQASDSQMVQSGADVTKNCHDDEADPKTCIERNAMDAAGNPLYITAGLQPFKETYAELGLCPVNIHWHLGAEHRSAGQYDVDGHEWMAQHGPKDAGGHRRKLAGDVEPGNFCRADVLDVPADDKRFEDHYHWHSCVGMHVGLTYEIHWPHSNLGACGTEWQFQSHFMDGVLCRANENNFSPADAVAAVGDRTAKIGVQAQVFTIIDDDAYDYPEWDVMTGWHTGLANDVAIYQGSTTGQLNGNEVCRGTGGAVTWQVDRECHLISAKKFDEMCATMLHQKDDMSGDVHAHNARETTDPFISSDLVIDHTPHH